MLDSSLVFRGPNKRFLTRCSSLVMVRGRCSAAARNGGRGGDEFTLCVEKEPNDTQPVLVFKYALTQLC